MSKRPMCDTMQLRHMNVLLEVALALPEDSREEWLRTLPPQHRALTPSLRVLLQRAREETDGFMRRSPRWLRRVPLDAGPGAPVRAAVPPHDGNIPPVPGSRAPDPRQRPDPHALQQLTTLLRSALELPAEQREGWLHALPDEHRVLVPLLRAMLQRSA